MSVSHKKDSQNTWIVSVAGRLDQSQCSTLEQTLVSLVDEQARHIVVDLSETDYINSGGLRILVTARRLLRRQQGELILAGLSERLLEVFGMVGFDKVFEIVSSKEAALKKVDRART